MKFEEYGENGLPVVLLLHKGGLSGLNDNSRLEALGKIYHLVAPVLTGSGKELVCQAEETEISEYVRRCHDGKVFVVCCMTDSWRLARCVLQDKAIKSDKTIVEIGCEPGEMIISSLEEIAEPIKCVI